MWRSSRVRTAKIDVVWSEKSGASSIVECGVNKHRRRQSTSSTLSRINYLNITTARVLSRHFHFALRQLQLEPSPSPPLLRPLHSRKTCGHCFLYRPRRHQDPTMSFFVKLSIFGTSFEVRPLTLAVPLLSLSEMHSTGDRPLCGPTACRDGCVAPANHFCWSLVILFR